MTSITRTALLAGLACTVALASGCGSGSSSSDAAKVTKTTAAAPATKKVSAVSVGVKAPGLIAFRRYTDSSQAQGAVFTIKPDGSGEKQVTHPPTNYVDDQPAFSADGSKIAFARCPTEDPKPCVAWVVNREGSGATRMEVQCPRPDCDVSDPAWSQDGRVALIVASGEVKQGPGGNQIDHSAVVVFDPKRGTQRTVAHLDGFKGDLKGPAWSPDGSRIVYERQWSPLAKRGGLALFVVSSKGHGTPRRLTPEALAGGDHPVWSPDGKWIAFRTHADQEPGAGPTELSLIHPDGRGLRHLKTPEDDVLSAGFSPDGEWLAFAAPGVGGTYDVWAMRVDGSDMHPITRTASWDSAPDWGP
jgi:TolB protein